tara:strand:+ start:911 stop:1651 length:741 start_codon:yes stop_codon:yes gene_type:complete
MNKYLPETEKVFPKELWIDTLKTDDAINLILKNQKKAIDAIAKAKKDIHNVVEKISLILQNNSGSLIYVGAGSSGRLGVLDGVELPPTFGWSKSRIKFLLAGGTKAMFESAEKEEDEIRSIASLIKGYNVGEKDIVIGLSASGSTRFTVKSIIQANNLGALTIGIANNKNAQLLKAAKYPIFLDTGPEVIAGSTRMTAGTAQKICLNVISTLVMTKLGRVKNGLMIKMKPTNQKLSKRHSFIKSMI